MNACMHACMCVCMFKREYVHYNNEFCIYIIMSLKQLIDNYHNKSDGLACKLTQPCCRPGYSSIDYDRKFYFATFFFFVASLLTTVMNK